MDTEKFATYLKSFRWNHAEVNFTRPYVGGRPTVIVKILNALVHNGGKATKQTILKTCGYAKSRYTGLRPHLGDIFGPARDRDLISYDKKTKEWSIGYLGLEYLRYAILTENESQRFF